MRHLNFRFAVPVGSFLLAVVLSWLGGGTLRPVLARQSAGVTTCTGSANAQSITVAAGSGIKRGIQGWNFAILDQPVAVQNSKTASMSVGDMLTIDVQDVVGIDDKHKKHPLGTLTLKIVYDPLTHDYPSLPPPGSTVNAIPSTVTVAMIEANLLSAAVSRLPTYTIQKATGNLKAQTTLTKQFITLICDGIELPNTPRPNTLLPVDNNGNGKAVKN